MKKRFSLLLPLLLFMTFTSCVLIEPGLYIISPVNGQTVSSADFTILIKRPEDMVALDTCTLTIGPNAPIHYNDENYFIGGQLEHSWDTTQETNGYCDIVLVMVDSSYPDQPYSNHITVYVFN